MIRQKKAIKRVVIVVFFISIVFISNVQIINHSIFLKENINDENQLVYLPNSANPDVDEHITGLGVDQDVRIYVNNESENFNDNQNFFEIPSISSDDMYLTHGDFNFEFQNNFTTDYVLEDNDALYADKFIYFNYSRGYSGVTITNGTLYDGIKSYLMDGNTNNYVEYNATQGVLNFTIKANYTNTKYTDSNINGNVEFNRSNILGLISSLLININKDVNLTVKLKNYTQSTWEDVISNLRINSSVGKQELNDHFINTNLNFIDISSICYIQFIFKSDDLSWFNTKLYEFDLRAIYAFDLPITDQEYVALEFDLKGKQSTVNGFYAWIRTLNLTKAATSQLNITLYRSNATVVRTDGNLRTVLMSPDYNELIDTQLVSYNDDQLRYFGFNIANTQDLNLSNYFIVIKSTNSDLVYSLVTLPYYNFGEAAGRTEHQLIITGNNGVKWKFAQKVVITDYLPTDYKNHNPDASSFKLNVTRGYMPSDFMYEDNNTLRIQDLTIDNYINSSYPYNESSYLTWGIGRWNNIFPITIEDTPSNKFQINLNWNRSIIEGFKFNVSSYLVKAYWIEGAMAYYNATYNVNPEWALHFDLNKSDTKFNNWDFFEFWYVYPNFMSAHNITNPDDKEFFWLLEEESIVEDSPHHLKLVINETFSSLNGIYTLNLTSYNFIDKMHTYINYYGILWETNGFMYGDNISVSVDIQDNNFQAPLSGDINATLFYPNGTRYPNAEMISSSGVIEESVLTYDFNNNTILDLTNDISVLGKYELGFFWFNGSALGCKKITLYIDAYDLELYNCTYISYLGTNTLIGEMQNAEEVFDNYTILIASFNDTTGISNPNFYPINNTDLNQVYSYVLGTQELTLLMDSFLQSEDILNPNETVNFKVSIQNTHSFIPIDVSINVKLVSYMNEEWIIGENDSPTVSLNFSGTPDDTYEFDVNLTIPNIDAATNTWEGLNAPIRLGGAKAVVTISIDDIEIGVFESPDYLLLSNEISNNFDGHILGLAIGEEASSRGLQYEFERDECLYYPDNASFLVNIIDKNYVSSFKQFNDNFLLNLNSKFTNVSITPDSPRTGEIINVSSILTTEFGDELSSKNVTCEYYNSSSKWVNIGSDLTDTNGSVTFLINTATIDFNEEEDLILKLSWDGDTINGVSKNITIDLIQETNNFSISIRQNKAFIYKSKATTLRITINNFGDSNLRFFNISVNIDENLLYSIVEINNVKLDKLEPDESTEIVIEIEIPQIDTLNITFTITAQNILTGENITISEQSSFKVFDTPLSDYFVEFLMFIMIAIFAVVWIIAIIFALRVRKRIEEPVEKVERRPRKGRYVMVSDLKKPELPKKVPKKAEEAKPEKLTDLDSLLEERGLADKKKKPKK
ncbi:MAG: CARDB domain-containing protein [Promethearchaeota archaeon]